ncbi:hypothetical protein VTN00DRAFT_3747 [Thermoascus crustaceus]|uniref:uncharacterized protein n=1 Tax=Thermoascus crustaceus TaxID=5088 RepID=UPI003743A5D3
MADADEDAIHLPSSHDSAQVENDLSDETQDFRFLNHLALVSDPSQASLPRRGEKDFEPNPTLFQSDALAASRQAMHNALAFPRLHHPKNRVVGIYAPDGPAPPPSAVAGEEKGSGLKGAPGAGIGVPADSCVYVPNPRGQYFRTMGKADRWNRVWLLPEEALYLLERGSLDIMWPLSSTGSSNSAGGDDNGDDELSIPMSLQAAYACFIGHGGLTLERFTVYSGLKRSGYTLVRAPSWDESVDETECEPAETQEQQDVPGLGLIGYLGQLFRSVYNAGSTASTAAGPVVGLGIHRSYNDIYRRLTLIPAQDPTIPNPPPRRTEPPFRLAFHVYKPSTPFKKSAPPEPDFRIAVINSRTQITIPTLSQISALLESTPLDPPRGEKMERLLYMRLRHGYRNVILAVVDQGVVSFLRVADAGFSRERIYEGRTLMLRWPSGQMMVQTHQHAQDLGQGTHQRDPCRGLLGYRMDAIYLQSQSQIQRAEGDFSLE